MPLIASRATSDLNAELNFRLIFFIGHKIKNLIFLSSFFRPPQKHHAFICLAFRETRLIILTIPKEIH